MSISEPKRHRAPRRRKRAGARTLGATPHDAPTARIAESIHVELRDGTSYTLPLRGRKLPASWKSWAMRQLPYGTDFLGVTFRVEYVGLQLTENPNRGKRHGASATTRTRGGLTPNESARIADGRKRHEPLTVITPIVRDRAGRSLPANRRASSSYTI